jgi:isopropylmalate/homocitrate/citramalate synthase
MWLEQFGVEASEEEATKMTAEVKQLSLKHKRLLTEDEFRSIVRDVLGQRSPV